MSSESYGKVVKDTEADTSSHDFLILGGGIVGCALSFYLTYDHGQSVLLYEKETLASGASGKAGGLISSQCWNDHDIQLVEESKREYRRLAEESGTDIYGETGGIRTVSTDEGVVGLTKLEERLKRNHVEARRIGRKELEEIYPQGVFEDVLQGIFTPTDATVLPADLTQLYGRLSAQAGTRIEYSRSDVKIDRDGENWKISVGGEVMKGDNLVVAAGAWSKKVLSSIGLPLPISPYLTRACLLKASVPGSFPYFHDNDLDVYIRPFPGGDILAGDGTELTEVDPDRVSSDGDITFLENIAEFMGKRFPGWAASSVRSAWRGVCSSTPDRRPLIGRYPGERSLYVATGFNGFGIMRAGGAARRMASALAGGRWDQLKECNPARFSAPYPPFPPTPGFTLE